MVRFLLLGVGGRSRRSARRRSRRRGERRGAHGGGWRSRRGRHGRRGVGRRGRSAAGRLLVLVGGLVAFLGLAQRGLAVAAGAFFLYLCVAFGGFLFGRFLFGFFPAPSLPYPAPPWGASGLVAPRPRR